MNIIPFSARRTRLASFENANAVAIQLRETTGIDQFVFRTDNPVQPVRVTRGEPNHPETVIALAA